MTRLCSLAYYGGKSSLANQGTGRWIADLLPQETYVTYAEPFCGMLGVMLQRPKSHIEIANDVDKRIWTWWTVVRDRNEELIRKLRQTPYSRVEFEMCKDFDVDDTLELARRVTVVLTQGLHNALDSWSWRRSVDPWCGGYPASATDWLGRIERLQDRIREVQFECYDACKLLERLATEPGAVVYCDPPYRTADTKPYAHKEVDVDRMTEALRACRGRVAVGRYRDEWDHLGWIRNERIVKEYSSVNPGARAKRTEILWTNYQPEEPQLTLFDDF